MRLPPFILLIASFVTGLPMLNPVRGEDNPSARPAILLVGSGLEPAAPYRVLLRKLGYGTDVCGIRNLKEELLRKYHLVILTDMDYGLKAEEYDPAFTLFDQYLGEGGSLLLYAHAWWNCGRPGCEGMNRTFKKWGGEVLFEQVTDPTTEFFAPTGFHVAYYYRTSNIAPDPLTAGVQTIFYPSAGRGHFPGTYPFKLDAAWKVLVRSSKESKTRQWNDQKDALDDKAGEAPPESPLVAVRTCQAGKIAVVGLTSVEVVYGIDNWAWGNVALKEGDGKTRSDFGKLMENLYAWLVKSATPDAQIGGYVEPPLPEKKMPQPPRAIQWQEVGLNGEKTDWGEGNAGFGGIIGIHSNLSTGKDAPEAYIAKAREMGLNFILFTEDFASMTPEKWNQLKAACEKEVTTNFIAMPGIEYRDAIDRRYFVGPSFSFPKPGYLSADGKRIIDMSAWFDFFNAGMHGPFLVKQSPVGYWTFALYNHWPVYTYERGKLFEDAFAEYLAMNKIDDEPQPAVMDLIYSVEELQKAAAHPRTYIRQGTLSAVKTMLMKDMYFTGRLQYVSRGPRILWWDVSQEFEAGKDRDNLTGWWHIKGGQRYRMLFWTQSDQPLKEVLVYDGPDVIRRYRPNGTEFKLALDMLAERQRALCVVVTDQANRQAVTGSIRITDGFFWRFMCSDRGNSIVDSMQFDDQGKLAIWGPSAYYQRKGTTFGFSVGQSGDHCKFWIPCIDGGFYPAVFQPTPTVIAEGLTEPDDQTLNKVMVHPMTSRDVCIQEDWIVAKYPKGKYTDVWHGHERTTPLELFENRVRYIDFIKRYGDPGMALIEYELKAKKDVTFPKDRPLSIMLMDQTNYFQEQKGMSNYVFQNPSGTMAAGAYVKAPDQAVHFDEKLKRGAVYFQYPNMTGAPGFFALDDGMRFLLDQGPDRVHYMVGFFMPGETVKKGTVLKARLVVFRGRCGTENRGTKEMEDFRAGFGFGAKTGYQVNVKKGKIREQVVALDLEAEKGGFSAVISQANLPLRLPIRIWGLNDQWSAGIYDRKEKRWNPFGIIAGEGVGYASLDTSQAETDVFIGNLVQCDNPKLVLTFLENGNGKKKVVAHNPTDREIAATVQATEGFDPIAGFKESVKVPPGDSVEVKIAD